MLKTTFKIFMLFILMAVVSVATGVLTYNITKASLEENSALAAPAVEVSKTAVPLETSTDTEDKRTNGAKFDYYLVKLCGEEIGIYVSHDGKEEFLYSHKIFKNDLSQHDFEMLSDGIKLYSASSLTGFLEDFTS